MTKTAAIIGGGVIGGGWAARFALSGWDVAIFDPDPEAERKISEVMANARRSLPALSEVALPPEGQVKIVPTIAEAVADADWIQESAPERLEMKHKDLQRYPDPLPQRRAYRVVDLGVQTVRASARGAAPKPDFRRAPVQPCLSAAAHRTGR